MCACAVDSDHIWYKMFLDIFFMCACAVDSDVAFCTRGSLTSFFHSVTRVIFLELYTTVLPSVFSVLVFCWYQICWISGITVGIVVL